MMHCSLNQRFLLFFVGESLGFTTGRRRVPAEHCPTPLHVAAREGREGAVRLLLEGGADPNVREKECDRPTY